MKIAVVGANGRVGNLVVKEALTRGYEVSTIFKGENKHNYQNTINKDALFLTKEDLAGFDAVVDAVGGWTAESIPNITNVMTHLADILENTSTRLVVVGGAGSLFVNKEHTITVDMGPEFPDSWKPLSNTHGKGLEYLRNSKALNWTYISPACNFDAEGVISDYKIAGEELELNSKGESIISYATFAKALIENISNLSYNKKRISLVSR